LGLINPALYKLAADPAKYATDFFDIAHTAVAGTENTNQADPSVARYAATQGWDPMTGLGTPNAAALIPDLVDASHGQRTGQEDLQPDDDLCQFVVRPYA